MNGKLSPLSILHVLAPARFGGLETVVVTLASGLADIAGDRVCVAPVLTGERPGDHPLVRELEREGIAVAPIVLAARDYLGERRQVERLLALRGAHILHTHGARPDVISGPVGRKVGVATITTVHGFTGGGWKNRMYERLQRRSFRRFDGVIAVSDKLREELVDGGIERDRVHAVRNAWRPVADAPDRAAARNRLGLPPAGRLVAWVGRMTSEKGPDVMIRAAARVTQNNVRFSMIGAGRMEDGCRVLAETLGVSPRVDWRGVIADVGHSLAAFDALVITSSTEGTPMVLLEAMALGVPVVATAVGGIPDVVSPAEAHLCRPGAVAEIAAAIDDVLADRGGARIRAEAAKRRLLREFAMEPWIRRHHEIYHSVLGG